MEFDYYQYFVNKGNHPDKESILQQEKSVDIERLKNHLDDIVQDMKEFAPKPIGVRIICDGEVILQYLDASFNEEALNWLSRKEKVVNETKHSSYYIFLDNITSHQYDHMIHDDSYGICGGGFPLLIDGTFRGTVAVTGCRPTEDHDTLIHGIEKYFTE